MIIIALLLQFFFHFFQWGKHIAKISTVKIKLNEQIKIKYQLFYNIKTVFTRKQHLQT